MYNVCTNLLNGDSLYLQFGYIYYKIIFQI